MPDASIVPVPTKLPKLGPEWREAADVAANNLGFVDALADLSPEHWQLVLASVTDRMLLHGATFTEEAWIYPQPTEPTNYYGILGHQPGSANDRAPSLWLCGCRLLKIW